MPTVIKARLEGDRVALDIDSECPMVRSLAEKVKEIDPLDCLKTPINENPIILAAGESLRHASCPVPLAIIKAAEACCGMAVEKDVRLTYSSSSSM